MNVKANKSSVKMVEKNKKFTPRQQKFIDEYLVDLNGTQAAIEPDIQQRQLMNRQLIC